MANTIKQYLRSFEELKKVALNEPAWLLSLREEALTAFTRKGFPASKDDAWRYTDVTPIRETAFDFDEAAPELPAGTLETLKQKDGRNFLLVVNGKIFREHSSVEAGIEVMDLAEAIVSRPDLVESYLGRQIVPGRDAFSALNAGLFKHGLFICVPEDLVMKEPLHIVFFAHAPKGPNVFQIRNLVVIGKRSEAAIMETYMAGDGKGYFTNVVTEIVLEEDAVLQHCKIQREHPEAFHIASTQVVQRRASSFVSFALSTGARLMRQDCCIALTEEGASCALNGLYLGDKDQTLDHQTLVDHRQPDGKSDQFFKGLLAGNSRGVFRGRVVVCQDAQRTDAHQTHKALLLSDGAKVDTEPQLEILADDVKCSHGTAVGQLQEDAVFYLRSRGIDKEEAGRILARGFAREVIERSELDLFKETLLDLVDEKLTQQLSSKGK
jgi:Fe-S cluster assembly protein SufD